MLVIAIFLAVVLEIHPFQDGNGRVRRILTTLLLLRAGYAYVPYSSLERVIEHSKEGYYLALRQTPDARPILGPPVGFHQDFTSRAAYGQALPLQGVCVCWDCCRRALGSEFACCAEPKRTASDWVGVAFFLLGAIVGLTHVTGQIPICTDHKTVGRAGAKQGIRMLRLPSVANIILQP